MVLSKKLLIAVMFVYVFLSITPFLVNSEIRGIYYICLLSAIFVVLNVRIVDIKFVYLALSVVLFFIPVAVFWMDVRFIGASIFISMSILILAFLDLQTFIRFVELSSRYLLFVLALAVISYVYALLGFESLGSYILPDGRESKLYLTSFTVSIFSDGTIRPTGIYDEPGTLTLLTCMVVAIRHFLRLDFKVTALLIVLTSITFSASYLLFLVFWVAAQRTSISVRNVLLLIFTFIVFAALMGSFMEKVISRFDGENIENESRLYTTLFHIDELVRGDAVSNILFGISPSCRFLELTECSVANAGYNIGDNPTSYLIMYGLLASLPYYLVVFIGFLAPFIKREYFVLTGVSGLLLVNPYLYSSGYALLVTLVYFSCYIAFKNRKEYT